jgi:hypothetical protein
MVLPNTVDKVTGREIPMNPSDMLFTECFRTGSAAVDIAQHHPRESIGNNRG